MSGTPTPEPSGAGATAGPGSLLSARALELRDEARSFAPRLRAEAARREWEADPAARVSWDLVEEASRRGWRALGLPRQVGGGGATVVELCVLIEELAAGDMGFSVILDQTFKVQRILLRLATGVAWQRFLDRFLDDHRCVLAICFTEPEVGSDYVIPFSDFRFGTQAVQQPDGSWVLNGAKRFISNGADAGFYVVFACTDPGATAEQGTSAFLVEPGMPGFDVVEVHEKISQRTINNGALRFTDVVLEPWRLLGEAHRGYLGCREILKESAIEAGATTLGTARAAYEMAVEHARQRVQGGRPLIEHPNVAIRLGRMFATLEAARSLVWRAAWAVEHDPDYDYRLGSAAKAFAADAAVEVCLSAMEVHGGLAVMYRDCGVEKCLRDCVSFLHSDGAQDSHFLRIGDLIRSGTA